ncbi:CRISPR-associated endonuclease Cas1 [Candidatus Poribacteria bacterium]|nr:CRISPR-associated endonuclease Cas1 [Candidatus Poribacteria bacterium]
MSVVYVTEQGASVRKTSKRILIMKDGKPLQVIRLHELEKLVLFGNIQLTTQAMTALLNEGIEVSFLSSKGKFRGRLSPLESKNIPLRISQYKRYNDMNFRLSIAHRIVERKIRNGRSLIMRYKRTHSEVNLDTEIQHLDSMMGKVSDQNTIPSLMGVEGESAATYFRAYGRMFLKDLQFSSRSRRPPGDPANALLSLGYALLTNEALGILAAQGLDIHIGFLHEIHYGRPSLALDMVEEFRQPVVDRFVLSLANRLVFTVENFDDNGDKGVLLNKDSFKRYLALYDRMMNVSFKDKESDRNVSFRSLLSRQAQRIAKCILEEEEYKPFIMR